MTDRELLKAAAKAAGLLPLLENKELDFTPDGGLAFCGGGEYTEWNPFTDDGDALRLVVQLGMSLDTALGQSLAIVPLGTDQVEPHNGDPYIATRRAIVRAAAALSNP